MLHLVKVVIDRTSEVSLYRIVKLPQTDRKIIQFLNRFLILFVNLKFGCLSQKTNQRPTTGKEKKRFKSNK
jgi:hypothetical protein